jgi:hypothetical protein
MRTDEIRNPNRRTTVNKRQDDDTTAWPIYCSFNANLDPSGTRVPFSTVPRGQSSGGARTVDWRSAAGWRRIAILVYAARLFVLHCAERRSRFLSETGGSREIAHRGVTETFISWALTPS